MATDIWIIGNNSLKPGRTYFCDSLDDYQLAKIGITVHAKKIDILNAVESWYSVTFHKNQLKNWSFTQTTRSTTNDPEYVIYPDNISSIEAEKRLGLRPKRD